MSVRRLFVALALAGGCEESQPEPAETVPPDAAQRYATARCDAMFACACEATAFVDHPGCVDETERWFDEMATSLDARRAHFDVACLDRAVEYWESSHACVSPSDGIYVDQCALFVGGRPRDQSCEGAYNVAFGADDCAGDLDCTTGICAPSEELWIDLDEGESCGEPGERCGSGLFCDPSTSTCTLVLNEDAPCPAPDACRFDLFCSGATGLCEPRLGMGAACDPTDHRPCGAIYDEGVMQGLACIAGNCEPWQPTACGVDPFPPY